MNKKVIKMIEDFQLGIALDQGKFEQDYEAFKYYEAQLRLLESLRLNVLLMQYGYGYTPTKPAKKSK